MARGKHKSALSDLNRSLKWLETFVQIKKIVLGLTENCRHRYTPGVIRVQRVEVAGIKAKGYSGNGVVDVFIVVDSENVEFIKNKITERWS